MNGKILPMLNMFSWVEDDVFLVIILILSGSSIFAANVIWGYVRYKRALRNDKECTFDISATIIGFKVHSSEYNNYYTPIYEYYYNDVRYTYASIVQHYDNEDDLGFNKLILINPINPKQAYEKGELEVAKRNMIIGSACVLTVIVTAIVCYYLA